MVIRNRNRKTTGSTSPVRGAASTPPRVLVSTGMVCLFLIIVPFFPTGRFAHAATIRTEAIHNVSIHSIQSSSTPYIDQKAIHYHLDIICDTLPSFFWVYYDRDDSLMRIICLDVVFTYHSDSFHLRVPFQHMDIRELPTETTLSRRKSVIDIGLDPGWHYSYAPLNDTTLRLNISKEMAPQNAHSFPSRWRVIIYIILAATVGTITFGAVLAANR